MTHEAERLARAILAHLITKDDGTGIFSPLLYGLPDSDKEPTAADLRDVGVDGIIDLFCLAEAILAWIERDRTAA